MSYGVDDALSGVLRTGLNSEKQAKVEEAMSLGKLFYSDFRFYAELQKPDDEKHRDMLIRSLIVVQKLGELYAEECLS